MGGGMGLQMSMSETEGQMEDIYPGSEYSMGEDSAVEDSYMAPMLKEQLQFTGQSPVAQTAGYPDRWAGLPISSSAAYSSQSQAASSLLQKSHAKLSSQSPAFYPNQSAFGVRGGQTPTFMMPQHTFISSHQQGSGSLSLGTSPSLGTPQTLTPQPYMSSPLSASSTSLVASSPSSSMSPPLTLAGTEQGFTAVPFASLLSGHQMQHGMMFAAHQPQGGEQAVMEQQYAGGGHMRHMRANQSNDLYDIKQQNFYAKR